MKSGVCLKFANPDTIKSIEGQFENGLPGEGAEAEIVYFDGQASKVTMRGGGVIEGFVRNYVKDIDPETNIEKQKKKLYSLGMIRKGVPHGYHWSLLDQGIKVL